MSPRQRWLAALRLEPVDRLPFWPKLSGAYPPAQAEPFRGMALPQIHEWIGSDRHEGLPGCVRTVRSRTREESVRDDDHTRRTRYHTPHGVLELAEQFDAASQSWHPVRFPVQAPADLALLRAFFEDVRVELDPDGLARARAARDRLGEEACTMHGIGETALMSWVEWFAGVENAHWLLADCPAEVEALFEAMHRVLCDTARILAEHSPADVLYLVENTSTTLISPEQYRRYSRRFVADVGGICRAHDRLLVLHMCGHLKALLSDLATAPAAAFEAFTSPTLGDATLLDGRSACPRTCLIGGTNAVLWTRPAAEIIARLDHDLGELPHHRGLVITSAGVMPPLCAPATIREVGEWVKRYPLRLRNR